MMELTEKNNNSCFICKKDLHSHNATLILREVKNSLVKVLFFCSHKHRALYFYKKGDKDAFESELKYHIMHSNDETSKANSVFSITFDGYKKRSRQVKECRQNRNLSEKEWNSTLEKLSLLFDIELSGNEAIYDVFIKNVFKFVEKKREIINSRKLKKQFTEPQSRANEIKWLKKNLNSNHYDNAEKFKKFFAVNNLRDMGYLIRYIEILMSRGKSQEAHLEDNIRLDAIAEIFDLPEVGGTYKNRLAVNKWQIALRWLLKLTKEGIDIEGSNYLTFIKNVFRFVEEIRVHDEIQSLIVAFVNVNNQNEELEWLNHNLDSTFFDLARSHRTFFTLNNVRDLSYLLRAVEIQKSQSDSPEVYIARNISLNAITEMAEEIFLSIK